MFKRFSSGFVIASAIAALALAQTAPRPAASQRTAPTARPAQAGNSGAAPAENPADAMQRARGSLLRATLASAPDPNQAKMENVSFFAVPEPEPRTLKKHDLVTIIVREESQMKAEGSTDLKKEMDFDAKLEQFIKFENGLKGGAISDPVPEIKMSGDRNFKGEATVDRTDSLIFRITAEVVDVKPNGTLVLQARQTIKADDEEQTFTLSGVCRAEDVTPDNTVLSTQMFDKDLTKTHKGAVRDTTKRGWIPKLLDVLNPF
jgi:flagellar L-ring protein precursor FlgH